MREQTPAEYLAWIQDMRGRFRFFLEFSGYATPPGRAACALASARAELRAEELGITFEWSEDEYPDLSWCEACEKGKPRASWARDSSSPREQEHWQNHRLWICEAKYAGESLAQLCGIDFGAGRDPWMRDPYKRVVEAELAGESLACIDALGHVA